MFDKLQSLLIPNWRDAHKLWSVRVALFWAAMSGAYMGLAAFSSVIPPFYYAALCIGMSVALVIARLTNQPGLDP